jgi:peptidoglycan/xylan/chitin deacetylase (PgdA/CDA1 family)
MGKKPDQSVLLILNLLMVNILCRISKWNTRSHIPLICLKESIDCNSSKSSPPLKANPNHPARKFIVRWFILVTLGLFLAPRLSAQEQLLNLPLPSDGLRYRSYAEIEPKWPATHGVGSVCLWGDDRFAAVSITIDDNNTPDFPFWRQVSADNGWKLTWFVIVHPYLWDIYNNVPGSNTGYYGTAALFKTLYDEGHEVELHGSDGPMNSLSDVDYEDHVVRSINHMESVIGNQMTTFAYPSGEVDRGDGTKSFIPIIGRYLISARGTSGGATPVTNLDYLQTKSMGTATNIDPLTSNWAKMEQKPVNLKFSAYRGWAVCLFHKVQDQASTLATMNFIKAGENAGKYWVKPYSHVARYAQERESSTLTVTSVSPSKIAFTLSDRMHDGIFNVPLTVKFRTNGWTGAKAHQNGTPVPVRLVTNAGATYALVDAIPDRGPVALRATAPDTDNDGMPDVWESEQGFNPGDPADASLDEDKDGRTNREEFQADTLPKNHSDRLINWLEREGEGFTFVLSPIPQWATPWVEYSPNLIDWYPLTPSVISRESGVVRLRDPAAPTDRRFYRLKLTEN